MTFKDWVKQFTDEDSERGILARTIQEDAHFPDTGKWVDVNYRLHLVNDNLNLFITLNSMWQKYKLEHGENILYFDLTDSDGCTIFSEFIKEKEAYQVMFKLQESGIKFDLISEAENMDDGEDDFFIIETDEISTSLDCRSLDELMNRINKSKNIIPFPSGKVTN